MKVKLFIDPSWTYNETVKYIKLLKDEYQEILSSFSMWERREWADFICDTRDSFYSLNLMEWQIEFLWKYMNGYMKLSDLKKSASRYK